MVSNRLWATALLSNLAMASPFWASAPHEHVVMFDRDVPADFNVTAFVEEYPDLSTVHVRHWYRNDAFQGFSAPMTKRTARDLARLPGVAHVKKSVRVRHAQVQSQSQEWVAAKPAYGCTWGQQRISGNMALPETTNWLGYTKYIGVRQLGGYGADIYIIDTGVNVEHDALRTLLGVSRASAGWTYDNANYDDLNGHGTHVAGTAAGRKIGAASAASVISVRALDADGGGDSPSIIAAINYVIQQHQQKCRNAGFIGSVINLSLESNPNVGRVPEIDTAIGHATSLGINIVVAAGNLHDDACKYTPAATAGSGGSVISVGSVNRNNAISDFSNYGSCVDIYAPGEEIFSSWKGPGLNASTILSGTSMAAPHVTGIVAALMVQFPTMAMNPKWIKEMVLWLGLKGLVTGDTRGGGAPIMAYSGAWSHGV